MRGRVFSTLLLALAVLAAGCIRDTAQVDPASVAASDIPGASLTSYLSNLSEPLDGVDVMSSLVEHLSIEAPDGILLDTWIVRPDVEGPVPLVLTVTPYYGGGSPIQAALGSHQLGTLGETLVPRGYAVGISSVRGTGSSGGCFTQGGPTEALDTVAVIEALAAQPWSNGAVGLIGVSYDGTTPQDVWIEAPPALKTIVPVAGISDFYKYNFVNGVPIVVQGFGFNTYYWGMVGLTPSDPVGGVLGVDPTTTPFVLAGEACADQVAVQEAGVTSTIDGNKDAYWQARDFVAELAAAPAKERASVFYVHGLQDWNVKPHMMEDWLPALRASGVPHKILLGQWGHAWPDRADWFGEDDGPSILVAWFDQFLKGVETGILEAPAVQIQDDADQWRHESDWPPADVEWLTLYPATGGALADAPGSGDASYHDGAGGVVSPLATRVEFASEPLAEDLQLSGMPRFVANVTAQGKRASLMLTLVERTDAGDRAFNFAALSLNHAANLEAGVMDVSGVTQAVDLRFFPQDDVVHKGSRLVLVASGNLETGEEPGPSLQPTSDGGEIAIHLDGASLTLPVDLTLVYEDPQPEPAE